MTETEKQISSIISGNREEFRQIILDNQRLVYHIVAKMIANPADHEDLCQDIFIRVYQNLHKFHYESKLSTWIASIAYNNCVNYLKKKKIPLYEDSVNGNKSIDTYPVTQTSPEQHAAESDISSRLKYEIRKLPAQFKTIITLFHVEQMSYQEIAQIMSMPAGTVKSYLFRARKLLKKNLEKTYHPEEIRSWT